MNKASETVKKSAKKGKPEAAARRAFPYSKVAKMWESGKTIKQIAIAIDRYDESKPDPLHGLRVALTKMHAGWKDKDGKVHKLPHRIGRKALRLATKAGLTAKK